MEAKEDKEDHLQAEKCQLGPSQDKWCKFHKARDHSTEECRLLKSHIEKLIQDGYLGRFVRRMKEEKRAMNDHNRKDRSRMPSRDSDRA
ncbi:hypothetical protein CR513_08854, partial [Mucuna pruriens]